MNLLSGETSPYLLQHAANPVDWHPWGPQAIDAARVRDVPILLSIGYSTCHWCHVMAHESFEDELTATLMNELFVNVKVDREERPDLDRFYQSAHAVLTGRTGGWPLTLFLNPTTLFPYFAGTYFPRETRYQLAGFKDILRRMSEVFNNDKGKTEQLSRQVDDAVRQIETPAQDGDPKTNDQLLADIRAQLSASFDGDAGGFDRAPKFPRPTLLENLILQWAMSNRSSQGPRDTDALDMVTKTLTNMARGGIYDQLAGGFFRYSTDRNWAIPHFEKMLNDNGLLLSLYADIYRISPDDLFAGVLNDTADWMRREMQLDHGGYRAAIDADSEGEEGLFYVWRRNEVKRLLTDDEYLVAETLYGLDKRANFENKWHLVRQDSWPSVARRLDLDRQHADKLLKSCREKLLVARAKRVPPARDDKVIASWNGHAIEGMAKASRALGRADLLASAQRAMDFMREEMFEGSRLATTWCAGRQGHTGFLDDYAAALSASLTLLELEWRSEDSIFATALADEIIKSFYDSEDGGFWFTRLDQRDVVHRHKPLFDDAGPSGNGLACSALMRLAQLTANDEYMHVAEHGLEAARAAMSANEASHAGLVNALTHVTVPADHIVLRGPISTMTEWATVARHADFNPWESVWSIPYQDAGEIPRYLPRLVSVDVQQRVTAFICRDMTCSAPINDFDEFRTRLNST